MIYEGLLGKNYILTYPVSHQFPQSPGLCLDGIISGGTNPECWFRPNVINPTPGVLLTQEGDKSMMERIVRQW